MIFERVAHPDLVVRFPLSFPTPHLIGPAILDTSLIDEVGAVEDEEAMDWARRAAREEGLLVGISSGAALAAAAKVAARDQMEDKLIVAIIPSCGARSLSTKLFNSIV